MTVVIFDGPEAAGKTTLIDQLQRASDVPVARVRRWGPVDSWEAYIDPLNEDLATEGWVVWDRGWAAEVAYNDLLKRGRDVEEWNLHRRLEIPLMRAGGLMVMVLAPVAELAARRHLRLQRGDGHDDLPVDPHPERRRFLHYAQDHGWLIVHSDRPVSQAVETVKRVVKTRRSW